MQSVIKLDSEQIQKLAIFESITKTSLKDFFEDEEEIMFIVNSKDLGKAIGKGASNIKLLEKKFKKKILMIGFEQDYKNFARNIFKPIPIKEITLQNGLLNMYLGPLMLYFYAKIQKPAQQLLLDRQLALQVRQ